MFEKYRKSVPSNDIVVTFLKMYRYRYRRYFFSKVLVPISSLLLKYRVPSSEYKHQYFSEPFSFNADILLATSLSLEPASNNFYTLISLPRILQKDLLPSSITSLLITTNILIAFAHVSAELCCPGAQLQSWAPSLFTRFGVIPHV